MASSPPSCPPFEFSGKYYSTEAGGSCVRQGSFFGGKAVLNQGVGYSVILGFGAFFAVFTSFLVWLEKRYVGSRHTSEWFNTAGRNVKTGLIASVIVSQWTWAATILQSSNVAWQYGVSGPFWYASGATIQVLLFGVMAIEIKRKAPYAHTVCEIVKARWGTAAHLVFLVFCFLTNIIVTAMLLLGGSAVVNALTGVNIYAASFLIPLGVVVYTLAGGLKATFLASYIHSVIGPWKQILGAVTTAKGFKVAGMYARLRAKGEKPDLALVTCDVDAVVAGAFTTNVVAAALVIYYKKALETSPVACAVLINAGKLMQQRVMLGTKM